MPPLHRHQLAQLTDQGWRRVLGHPWDDETRECLEHWATQRLPLVVTRQPLADPSALALGLAAPLRWQLRRISVQARCRDIAWFDEFPRAAELVPLIPPRGRSAWRCLCSALASLGSTARVYGSHGWQRLSDLLYLRAGSDIDLWMTVDDPCHADAVAAVLDRFSRLLTRRLDGELLFADGRAYAWREWQAWRQRSTRAVLCKTLRAASLEWNEPVHSPVPEPDVALGAAVALP